MKFYKSLAWGISLLAVFLIGCDKIDFLKPKKTVQTSPAAPPAVMVKGTAIAKINNMPITLEELNREIDVFNASIDLRQDLPDEAKKSFKIDTREKKLNYLKEMMVRKMVFYQGALDRGLDRKPDMVDMLNRGKTAILASEMQNEIIKNIEVSSTEVEEAYKAIKDQLKEPETRKVREIVTKTEDEARQALLELYQQGADFAAVARSRSIADTAKKGGDLGYIQKGQRGSGFVVFDEVAFSPALQEGSISSIFKGPEGNYYIIKVEGIKEGKQLSAADVWDRLKEMVLLRKQQIELDKSYSELSRQDKIEIYEGEVK